MNGTEITYSVREVWISPENRSKGVALRKFCKDSEVPQIQNPEKLYL
jgi:hypothetical protein